MVKTEEIPTLFMSIGEENKPCIQSAGSSDSPSRVMSPDNQGSTRPAPSFGPLSVLQTLLSAPFVAPTHKSDSEEKISTMQPSNDVALRSLLDLPRLDEKVETAAEAGYQNLSLQNKFSIPVRTTIDDATA
ncbi:unnamed protein product [Cylicocyclus nassatus]|uniref:Uncharacterized protein n=1 Tax=Cylicocyclus nassatus TaxID=53992 RepID=A0AA36H8C7_CYLNA|nr:unnamed protein product [Cylicocyclus nassatus]